MVARAESSAYHQENISLRSYLLLAEFNMAIAEKCRRRIL
jgi:hypothetical protein